MTDSYAPTAIWPLTHRVAVGAYLFRHGRILLIKRINPPQTFAPPGGRLEIAEDPIEGLKREVREETSLEIDVLRLAHYWYGSMDGERPKLLCLNFLANAHSGEIHLSDEHSEFSWVARDDIESGRVSTLNDQGFGYQPRDLTAAFDLYQRLNGA